RGVLGGQVEDMAGEAIQKITPRQLRYIHEHKTANLIQAAVVLGGMMAGLPHGKLKHITTFGLKVGLAFQITDDILNATGTLEQLGKAVKSDMKRHKHTAVSQWGIKGAQQRAEQLYKESLTALKLLGISTDSDLALVAYYVVHRSS
ncbi:MAG: polyprenyl synthetase family protein, partial [Candidatus Andersenbacteria bacterium]